MISETARGLIGILKAWLRLNKGAELVLSPGQVRTLVEEIERLAAANEALVANWRDGLRVLAGQLHSLEQTVKQRKEES